MDYGAAGSSGSAHGLTLGRGPGVADDAPGALQQPATAPASTAAATTGAQAQLPWSYWHTFSGEAGQDGSAQLGQPITWQPAPTHIAAAAARRQQPAAGGRLRHHSEQLPAAAGPASGSLRSGEIGDVGRPPPGPSRPTGAVSGPSAPAQAQAQQLVQSPMLCGEQLLWPGEPQPGSISAATHAAAAATATSAGAPSDDPVAAPAAHAGGPVLTAAGVDLSGSFAFASPSASGAPNGNGTSRRGRVTAPSADSGAASKLLRRLSRTPQPLEEPESALGDAANLGSGNVLPPSTSSAAGAAAAAAVVAAAAAAVLQQHQPQQGGATAAPAQQQQPQRTSLRVRRSKAVAEAQQLAAAAMPPPAPKAATARSSKKGNRSSATPPASETSGGALTATGRAPSPSVAACVGASGSHSVGADTSAPTAAGSGALPGAAGGNWLPQDGPLAGLINLRSPPGVARLTGHSIKCVLGGDTAASASASATQEAMASGPPPAQPGFSFLPFGGAATAAPARVAAGQGTASAVVARGEGSAAAGTPIPRSTAAAADTNAGTGTGPAGYGYAGGSNVVTSAWLQRSYSEALQPGEPCAANRPVSGNTPDPFLAHPHEPPQGLSPAAGAGGVAYLPVIYHAGFPTQPQHQPQQPQQQHQCQQPRQQHQQAARQPSPEVRQQPQQHMQHLEEHQPTVQHGPYPPTTQQPAQLLFSQPSLPYRHPAQQGVYALSQQPQYPQHAPEYCQYVYAGQAPPPQPYYAHGGGYGGGYGAYPQQMWYCAVPAAAGSNTGGSGQQAAVGSSSSYYAGSWAMEASGAAAGGPSAASSLYEQFSGPLGAQGQSTGPGGGHGSFRPAVGSQPTASPFRVELSQPAIAGARAAAADYDARQPSQAPGYGADTTAAALYARSHHHNYAQHQERYPPQPHYPQQQPTGHQQQLVWHEPSAQQQGPAAMYSQQPPVPCAIAAAPHPYEQQPGTQVPSQPDQHGPPQRAPYMLELPDLCLLMDIGSPGSFRQLRRISADGGGGGAAAASAATGATPSAAAASPARRGASGADAGPISPLALAALLDSPAVLSRRSSLALNLGRHDAAAAAATQGWLSPLPGLNRGAAKPPPAAAAPATGASARAAAAARAGVPPEEADAGSHDARLPRGAASAANVAVGSEATMPAPTQQRRGRVRVPTSSAVSLGGPQAAAGVPTAQLLAGPDTAAGAAAGEAAAPQPAAAAVANTSETANASGAAAAAAAASTSPRPRAPVVVTAVPFGASPPRVAGSAAAEDPDAMMSLFGGRDDDYTMYGSPGGLGGLGLGLGLTLGQQWSLTPLRSPSSLLVPSWRSALPSALVGLAADGVAGVNSRSTDEGCEPLPQAAGRAALGASPLRQHQVSQTQRGADGPVGSDESPGVLLLLRPNSVGTGGGTSMGAAAATTDAPGVVVAPAAAAASTFTQVAEPEAYLLRPARDAEDAPVAMAVQLGDAVGASGRRVHGQPPPPRKALHVSAVAADDHEQRKDEGTAAATASEQQPAPGQDASATQPKRAMLRRRGRMLQSEIERAAVVAAAAGAAGAEAAADKQLIAVAPRRAAAIAAAAAIARQAAGTDDRQQTASASAPGPASRRAAPQPSASEERTVTVGAPPSHQTARQDQGAIESAPSSAAAHAASQGAQDTASSLAGHGKRPRSASAPAKSALGQPALVVCNGVAAALNAVGERKRQPSGSYGNHARRQPVTPPSLAAPPSKPVAADRTAVQLISSAPEAKAGASRAAGTSRSVHVTRVTPAASEPRLTPNQGPEPRQPSAEFAEQELAQSVVPPPAKRMRLESKPEATASKSTGQEAKAQADAPNNPVTDSASAAVAGPSRRPPRHPNARVRAHTSAEPSGPQPLPLTSTAEKAAAAVPQAVAALHLPAASQPAEQLSAAAKRGETATQPAGQSGFLGAAPKLTAAAAVHAPSTQQLQVHQTVTPLVERPALDSTGEAVAAAPTADLTAAAEQSRAALHNGADPMETDPAGAQPPVSQAPSAAAEDSNQQSQEQQLDDQQQGGAEPLPQLPHKKRLLLQREKERTGHLASLRQLPDGQSAVGAMADVAAAAAPPPKAGYPSVIPSLEPWMRAAELPATEGTAAGTQPMQWQQCRAARQLQPEADSTVAAPDAGGPAAIDAGAGPSVVQRQGGRDVGGDGGQGRAGRDGLPASLLVVQPRAAAVRAAAAIAGSGKAASKAASPSGQALAGTKRSASAASEDAGEAPARKRKASEPTGKRSAGGAAFFAPGGSGASGSLAGTASAAAAMPGAPPSPQAAAAAEALTALGGGAGRGRGTASRPPLPAGRGAGGAAGGAAAAADRAGPAARADGTANQVRTLAGLAVQYL